MSTIFAFIILVSGVFGHEQDDATVESTQTEVYQIRERLDEQNCTQYTGVDGTCRPTRVCLVQQPEQDKWNACQWEDGERVPNKLCCYSEKQLMERLAKEINEYDSLDYEDIPALQLHPVCGVPKLVHRFVRPFGLLKRHSNEDVLDLYDMLFPTSHRVVMGSNVRVGQVPWMVSIYYHNQFVCGGSLIDDRHIVTAAHCFEISKNPDEFYVRLGSVMVHNGTVVRVDRIYCHERYIPPRIYHDIAVVRIANRIRFTDTVSPVCLPRINWINKNKLIGRTAYVAGFGDLSFGGAQARILQEVDLKILNNSWCETNYNGLVESRSKFPVGMKGSLICAGHETGGKDACQGDSGGPLTTNVNQITYLIGVVSFGYKCAIARFPGVYTFVVFYLKWILEKVLSP